MMIKVEDSKKDPYE